MDKVMRVYLCGQDWTESHEEMYLDLPATPWELVDALDKLNLISEGDLYEWEVLSDLGKSYLAASDPDSTGDERQRVSVGMPQVWTDADNEQGAVNLVPKL